MSKEESDLAAAYPYIAGGNVSICADVPPQLGHKALAEAHHFVVALAFRIEVRTTLAAAHRKRGQRVLEDLLEREKLQDSQIYRGVKAQAALIGADRTIHLDAESAIDLHVALIVEPGHAEHNDPFGFHNPLKDFG